MRYALVLLRRILCSAVFIGPAFAQTVDLSKTHCPGSTATDVQLALFVPATINVGGTPTTVSTPICVKLGSNIKLNSVDGKLVLDVDPQARTPQPIIKRLVLASDIPATQEVLDVVLEKAPVQGSLVVVSLNASRVGESATEFVNSDGTKNVKLTLPRFRPFNGDRVTIVYWSIE